MAKEQIQKRIEELEDLIFQVQMVDKWDQKEFNLFHEYNEELRKLKQKLEEVCKC